MVGRGCGLGAEAPIKLGKKRSPSNEGGPESV